MPRRHGQTACRLLAQMLQVDIQTVWWLVDAGRGLTRGLAPLDGLFADLLCVERFRGLVAVEPQMGG